MFQGLRFAVLGRRSYLFLANFVRMGEFRTLFSRNMDPSPEKHYSWF